MTEQQILRVNQFFCKPKIQFFEVKDNFSGNTKQIKTLDIVSHQY